MEILLNGINLNQLLERIGQLIDSRLGLLPANKKSQSEYLTRQEVAGLLKVSLPTLHDYTKQGWLTSYKIGTRVLYRRDELDTTLSQLTARKHRKGGIHG